MTTKAVKELKTHKAEKMAIDLLVLPVKRYVSDYEIKARVLVGINLAEFEQFQEEVTDELERLDKLEIEDTKFSLINEVRRVFISPETERKKDGSVKLNAQGFSTNVAPPTLDVLQAYGRIIIETDKALDKYGPLSRNHKTFTIHLKVSDALIMAERMQKELRYRSIPRDFYLKAINHFIEIEALAKKGGKEDE